MYSKFKSKSIQNLSIFLRMKNFTRLMFFVLGLLSMVDAFGQTTVTIPSANTNGSSKRQPYGNWYGYERTHALYLNSELGGNGTINSVSFYVNSVSSPAASTPVVIKMATTTATTVSSSTYATASAGATDVYTGNILSSQLVAGTWVTVTLGTPFAYTNNVAVFVEANGGGSGIETSSTAKQFRWSAPGATRCQTWQADTSPPTGSGTTSTSRPNIQLSITYPAVPPTCPTTYVPVSGATGISFLGTTLSWSGASGGPTSYHITFGTNAPNYDNIANDVDLGPAASYATGALSPSTTYGWSIKSFNATGNSGPCTVNTFTTGADLLMSNFNLQFCSGNFYDSGGSAGSYSAGESLTGTICPVSATDKVKVTFSSFVTESGYDFLKIYDGTGTGSLLGTYSGSTPPPATTSTAADGCLTFNFTSDGSFQCAGWASAVTCVPPATCPDPTALTATNATTSMVDVNWVQSGSVTTWDIYYGETATVIAPTAGSTPSVNDVTAHPHQISGLNSDTQYSVWVRADCGSTQSNWVGPVLFSTLFDCSSLTDISCATDVNTSISAGNGVISFSSTGAPANTCGFSTPGREKVYTFTPTVSGTHVLQVTAQSGSFNYIDWMIKPSSASGCLNLSSATRRPAGKSTRTTAATTTNSPTNAAA